MTKMVAGLTVELYTKDSLAQPEQIGKNFILYIKAVARRFAVEDVF